MIAAFWLILCLCVCLTLGGPVPELTYKDFQDQVYKDSKLYLLSNEASVLDACCTYFLYLSIVLHTGCSKFCGNTYV
jgi:hypothetical protein